MFWLVRCINITALFLLCKLVFTVLGNIIDATEVTVLSMSLSAASIIALVCLCMLVDTTL